MDASMPPLMLVFFVAVVIGVFLWVRARSGGAQDGEALLLRICRGNQEQADRLIAGEMSRAPGISRQEAARRAAERYQRDNR